MQEHIKNTVNKDDVKKLCKKFGLSRVRVELLGHAQNLVFGVTDEYVMKFIHSSHRNQEQLTAEAEFISHLEQYGLGVQNRIKADDQYYIEYENQGQQFWVGVETRAKGIMPRRKDPRTYNDRLIELWGETTAAMHGAAEDYEPLHNRFLFFDDPSLANAEQLLRENYGDSFGADYKRTLSRIMSLPLDKRGFGTVHYDLHYGNFYVDGSRLSIFDFDDCCNAHYIADVAVALFAHCLAGPSKPKAYKRETSAFMDLFMRGYERKRHMDELYMNALDTFMRYRRYIILLFYITDYDKRDPEAINGKKEIISDLLCGA